MCYPINLGTTWFEQIFGPGQVFAGLGPTVSYSLVLQRIPAQVWLSFQLKVPKCQESWFYINITNVCPLVYIPCPRALAGTCCGTWAACRVSSRGTETLCYNASSGCATRPPSSPTETKWINKAMDERMNERMKELMNDKPNDTFRSNELHNISHKFAIVQKYMRYEGNPWNANSCVITQKFTIVFVMELVVSKGLIECMQTLDHAG